MGIGGRLTNGFCKCGRPLASKGIDHNGKRHYRARCWKCISDARKHKKDKCSWCGGVFPDPTWLHVDHKDNDPSNNDPENLQTLCAQCHIKKGIVRGDWKPKYEY